MKPLLLVLTTCVLCLQSSFADWVVLQKNVTDGKTQELTLRVKGDKARVDLGDSMTLLTDAQTEQVTMLMHSQKMQMKLNSDSMKGVMALAGNLLGKEKGFTPKATGKNEKIGEYDCEIYAWDSKLSRGKFWVTKDFPNYQELNAAQKRLMMAMGTPTSIFASSAQDLPGLVVKSEVKIMGQSTTTELVSAKQEDVDESIFVVASDYKEMKLPTLPGSR